jgi:hypothetical protein
MAQFSVYLTKHHVRNEYGGMEVELQEFLTPTQDEVLSFALRLLHPRGQAPGVDSKGGWVDPKAGVHVVEKLRPRIERRWIDQPTSSLIAIPTELSWLLWEDRSAAITA